MAKKQTLKATILSAQEISRLQTALAGEGVTGFARRSGASSSAVTRIAAGLPARAGSVALVRAALAAEATAA